MNRRRFAWAAFCAVTVGVSSSANAQSAKFGGVRPLPSGRSTTAARQSDDVAEPTPVRKRFAAPVSTAPPQGVRPLPTGRGQVSAPIKSSSAAPGARRVAKATRIAPPEEAPQPIADESAAGSSPYYDEAVDQAGYYDETMPDNPWLEESEMVMEEPFHDSVPAMPTQRDFPWWARGEYIGWWGKGIDLPALVTSSPAGADSARAGLLGDPGTRILFGDDSYDDDLRGGVRFTMGYWLDHSHCQGIEGYVFDLSEGSLAYNNASTGGLPILARPFFNSDPAVEQYVAQLLSHPDVANGSFNFDFSTETSGAGILLRTSAARSHEHNVDFLGGYRYTKTEDSLRIEDQLTSTATGGNVPLGTVVAGFDQIETSNEFHGADLGMSIDFKNHRWTISLLGKCALGNMSQDIAIDGSTTVSVPGAGSSTTAGGLLTQPTNIGGFSRDKFTVVPEASVNVRYLLNCRWTAMVGYNFIYWNNVVRADDQIDFRVNTTQVGGGTLLGPGQPELEFKETDYWLQGVNAGLELHF